MDVNVNQMVVDALNLIGENEPNQTPEAYQVNEGIRWLNYWIAKLGKSGIYIPFFKSINFTMAAGQSVYTISPTGTPDITENQFADLDSCRILWQGTSYPVDVRKYDLIDYQAYNYADRKRPGYVIWQPGNTEDTITFYQPPDLPYTTTIRVKQKISSVSYGDAISSYFPEDCVLYLTFTIAKFLAMVYPTSRFTPQHEDTLSELSKDYTITNDINLVIQPSSVLARQYGNYFTDNNLDVS
jgi:hypothetical protein